MSGLLERIARRRREAALREGQALPAWQEPDPEPTPPIAEASDQPKWKDYLEPSDNGERSERATPPEPESSPRWFTAAGAWAQEPETNQVPAAEAEGAAYQQPAPPEAEAQGAADPQPAPPEAEPAPKADEAEPAAEPEAAEPAAEPEVIEPAAEPDVIEPPAPPRGLRARAAIRRRARYLRQLQEIQLRDLGGFMVELHRFGHERPDIVQAKVETAAGTGEELRTLDEGSIRELREAGIAGTCPRCGAIHGSADNFCAACGAELPSGK